MKQRPKPIGVNEPLEIDRRPIWKANGGDDLRLQARVILPGTTDTPVDPENSILTFVLADHRFSPEDHQIWEGTWQTGITEVDVEHHPGLVEVHIPKSISDTLRRGSFLYSLKASTKLGERTTTILEGSLLIEYAPTSPTHDIPYRD